MSRRQNDPFQWSLHRSQRVSGFWDYGGRLWGGEEHRAADILSESVITGQCPFNHAIGCLCVTAHVAVFVYVAVCDSLHVCGFVP